MTILFIIFKMALMFIALSMAWVIWELNRFFKYLGYDGFMSFFAISSKERIESTAQKRLKQKAHHLTFQGLRALRSAEEEHGRSREIAAAEKRLLKAKRDIEDGKVFKFIPLKDRSLKGFGGDSGERLRQFILEWNRFNRMVAVFDLLVKERSR